LDVAGTLRNTLGASFATTSGNVGIGTASPLVKLDIVSTAGTVVRTKGGTGAAQGSAYYVQFAGSTNTLSAFGDRANIFGGTVDQITSIFTGSGIPLTFDVNNAERMRIAANGNVGINKTPDNWDSSLRALQIGNSVSILGSGAAELGCNEFYDGANYKYITGNPAALYAFITGIHRWFVAPTGIAGNNITWTEAVRISNAGNFIIGSTTDPGAKLYVNGVTFINTTSSAGDYYLQVGGGIYATNNSVNLSIATQNNRFIAGEYGIGVGTGTFDASQTNGINVRSGTAPTTNVADVFVMYAADITAGNAAPHFRTENGNVIKIYQETTGVAASAFTANTGTAVNDASTFDGYTLKQVVKALRNLGILT
jgi:hypothetical protein